MKSTGCAIGKAPLIYHTVLELLQGLSFDVLSVNYDVATFGEISKGGIEFLFAGH